MNDKKLILHFDARNTIFVSDFHSRLTVENALNTYISGLVWGSVIDGEWSKSHDGISTVCPDRSLISFYKHMEEKIVKKSSDRPLLREILGKFTQQNGREFQSIFIEYLERLKWIYAPNSDLTVQGNDGVHYHYILPTFFNTLYTLHKEQRDFSLVIRTFGLDIPHILKAIKAFINGKHPLFPEKIDMKLCDFENTLLMTPGGYEYKFKYWNKDDIFTSTDKSCIFNHWNSADGVIAVRDDFEYWSRNNYSYIASKPLWINCRSNISNKIFHHIFFDDCIRPREDDSIVHLRRIVDADHDQIIRLYKIESYSDVNIVQSDLLECIKDKNYFLGKIGLCEKNFLKQNHFLDHNKE